MTDAPADAGGSEATADVAQSPAPAPQPEIPQEPAMPGTDPRPAETPVVPELPALEPKPVESPVIAPSPVETPAQDLPQPPAVSAASATPSIKDRAYAALEKIRFNKRKKLDRIVEMARKKGTITNNDVEMLLKVSHASATRYLVQLVREGRLARSGPQKQPFYTAY